MDIRFTEQIDGHTQDEWIFIFLDNVLYLDGYMRLNKPPGKRKYQVSSLYQRIKYDNRPQHLKESEVPLTESIKDKAHTLFCDQVKVLAWSEKSK